MSVKTASRGRSAADAENTAAQQNMVSPIRLRTV
jgi:hypothetical protein